jgi:hypothetical protein
MGGIRTTALGKRGTCSQASALNSIHLGYGNLGIVRYRPLKRVDHRSCWDMVVAVHIVLDGSIGDALATGQWVRSAQETWNGLPVGTSGRQRSVLRMEARRTGMSGMSLSLIIRSLRTLSISS